MWGIKATTIPVVIGVMVLIKKGLGKYVQQIVGNIKMHELPKITLLGTSHILRKALSIKYTSTSYFSAHPRLKEWARLFCCTMVFH